MIIHKETIEWIITFLFNPLILLLIVACLVDIANILKERL